MGEKYLIADGEVSNDDNVEEGEDDAWFGMGMTREEKLEAHWPWQTI